MSTAGRTPEAEAEETGPPSSDWLAEQVARFTADDRRRAAEVLLALTRSAGWPTKTPAPQAN